MTSQRELLDSFLEDIVLLHGAGHSRPVKVVVSAEQVHSSCLSAAGLGVRLVLVLGAQQRIDATLERQGLTPRYAGGCAPLLCCTASGMRRAQ